MEPPHGTDGGGSRAEAERWLVIAEKLLAGRDLVGSRTFAIRARESDPTIDAADQILVVAETLIAGEKRIGNLYDWYAILQLPHQTTDLGLIATHYRQLAILLNPHRNRLPFADEAFKLVYDAWSVLLNPTEKSMYDNELIMFSKYGPVAVNQFHHYAQQQQQEQPPEQPPPQPQLPQQPHPPLQPHPPPQQQQKPHAQPQPNQLKQQQQKEKEEQQQQKEKEEQQQQKEKEEKQQQQQEKEQQQQRHDSRPIPKKIVTNEERNVTGESELPNVNDDDNSLTFWTACPYCYNMYEYQKVYEGCSLRCQNCQRAFHGAKIMPPSPIVEGKESYFCCWGFFPLGISMTNLEKSTYGVPNWSPFSPMFTCPQFGVDKKVKREVNVQKGPFVYIDDDDDALLDVSESSEESDLDWRRITTKRKKSKKRKLKGSRGRNVKKRQHENVTKVESGEVSSEDLQGGPLRKEAMGAPSVPNAETSRKVVVNNAKKVTGKVTKERGKLDLNVEFSNEVEDPPSGMTARIKAGNGEEDGMEGIGFFEGLDEFFSSLPILNVVGAEKVKAT